MAYGIWPLAVDFRLSAKGIRLSAKGIWPLAVGFRLSGKHIWGSRTELVASSLHPPARWKGSLVEPLGAKWPPKAAKEDPKADIER